MYSISNRQRDEIISLLQAFVERDADKSLQAHNRRRRAMLLVRKLERKQKYGTRPARKE